MDAGYRFSKMGECTMAELQNGSIYMNMRPHEDPEKCDCRAYSMSHDNGATWNGPFFDHHLIHGPGCQASVLGSNGNTVYFSNPFTRDDSRNNMTVQISHDGATTWTSQFQVNTGPAACKSIIGHTQQYSLFSTVCPLQILLCLPSKMEILAFCMKPTLLAATVLPVV